MKLTGIRYSAAFRRDYKRVRRRHFDTKLLKDVIDKIMRGEPLPANCHDHILVGDYAGSHECHIAPDWLLVYDIIEEELVLQVLRTGTHSDIFG